jgi:hypothetical protein
MARIQSSAGIGIVSLGEIILPNPLFVSTLNASHIASGDLDIYTPPSGRKALFYEVRFYNDSASPVTAYTELKIGGSYYPLSSLAGSIGANNVLVAPSTNPFILDSTVTMAVNVATGSVVNVWPMIIEFDANAPIRSVWLTALPNNTDATVYTVPAGKKAVLLNSTLSIAGTGGLNFMNTSGSNKTIHWNIVPSGGSPATTNLATQVGTSVTNNMSSLGSPLVIGAGDFISINDSANTATQIAWVNVLEM